MLSKVSSRCRLHEIRCSGRLPAQQKRRVDNVNPAVAVRHKTHLVGDFARQQIIVRVQILHPLSLSEFEEGVAGYVAAGVFELHEANPISKTADYLRGAIGGSVVSDNDLLRRIGLRERAINGLPDPLL